VTIGAREQRLGNGKVTGGDGPEIQLKVYGLFSDVKVTDQPR